MSTADRPTSHGDDVGDPLAEIDTILGERSKRLQESIDCAAVEEQHRQQFLTDFAGVCDGQVLPAMEAVIDRLRADGGGSEIETDHRGSAHPTDPRLTVWLSLEGEIVGHPRLDRHPYLQLDALSSKKVVEVSEGDMWQGAGGNHSGRVGTWQLSEITSQLITEHLLAIIRRAAA